MGTESDDVQSSIEPVSSDEGLAAAQRIRHQAVVLAERMLRDVMGASGDNIEGLRSWQDAAMLRAVAEEEMAFANEESRRITAVAAAERDAMRARYSQERKALRAELQHELQASRDAAGAEGDDIKRAARQEADDIVKRAVERADETHRTRVEETKQMERRLATLQTALADAEARFRRLAATAANDLGTLQAMLSDVPADVVVEPEPRLATIDLTDPERPEVDEAPESEPGFVARDPDVGFYQRRLAGLRDRLEKSGNPPK